MSNLWVWWRTHLCSKGTFVFPTSSSACRNIAYLLGLLYFVPAAFLSSQPTFLIIIQPCISVLIGFIFTASCCGQWLSEMSPSTLHLLCLPNQYHMDSTAKFCYQLNLTPLNHSYNSLSALLWQNAWKSILRESLLQTLAYSVRESCQESHEAAVRFISSTTGSREIKPGT